MRCGICGANLRDVGSFRGSVADAARELKIEKETSDKAFRRSDFKRRTRNWLIGVLGGLAMIGAGFSIVELGGLREIVYIGYVIALTGFLLSFRAFFGITRSVRRR